MSNKRPTPKELAEALAKAAAAERGYAAMAEREAIQRGRIVELEKALDQAKGAITDREKELLADLGAKDRSIAKLKGKLFGVLQELWITKGYLARVAEDDAIRELGPKREAMAPAAMAPLPPVSRRDGPSAIIPVEPEAQRPHDFGRDRPAPPTPWFNL